MQKDAIGTVKERFDAYGDLYLSGSDRAPLYVTRHPDHIHEVLVTRASDFNKRADLEPFLGQGLLTSNGEHWRHNRRLIQPSFRHERLEVYASTMIRSTDDLLGSWSIRPDRDIGADMNRTTLRIVAKALFDDEAGPQVERVARCMDVLQHAATAVDLIPAWVPTPLHVRARRAARELDAVVYDLIDQRSSPSHSDASDLLGELLQTGELERKALRDELVTLYLAGHETTALALTWTWWVLAQHPEWERKLHDEVDQILGDRSPTAADLGTLDVTRRIINESMRLFPPVYALPRTAACETEVGGYRVPPGGEVLLWTYWAHRDPRWFVEPERFDPDRFLPKSDRIRHPHAFVPFGAGQRTCIGRNFAVMEAQLVLARIAQRYRLRPIDSRPAGLRPRITLGPARPLRMRAIERAA